MTPNEVHMNILEEAGSLVDGPREAEYGHPYNDFSAVGQAAAALGIFNLKLGDTPRVGRTFSHQEFALHHALYMVLVKIQRLVQTPDHRDSIVDGAGYFRTYEKILDRFTEDDNGVPLR